MPCVVLCLQRESYSMTQMTFRMLFCRRIFFVERPSHFFSEMVTLASLFDEKVVSCEVGTSRQLSRVRADCFHSLG